MAGAQIVFHPNAGMDALPVSRAKRHGRDGIPVRAFENAVYYVFANSVGPQGDGKWSAGDSKIVAPDGSFLQLADNRREQFKGRIVFTSPIVESGGDYRVFAEVENRQIEGTQQWLLRAGQTATLVIHSKEPPLPAVRK